MDDQARKRSLHIVNLDDGPVACLYQTSVGQLAATFCVEGSLFEHHFDLIAHLSAIHLCAGLEKPHYPRFEIKFFVAKKL